MSIPRDLGASVFDNTAPANGRHAGQMPRWATADATTASFATQRVKGHSDIYVPLATASLAGTISAANFTKLGTLQVPVTRLNMAASTDIMNAAALTGGTYADVLANQNFTATASGVYLVFVRFAVLVTAVAGAGSMSTRALINSAGSPVPAKLSAASFPAGGQASAGTGAFRIDGLPAGTNTIKLQVISSVNATGYCRANTQPNTEYAEVAILELNV